MWYMNLLPMVTLLDNWISGYYCRQWFMQLLSFSPYKRSAQVANTVNEILTNKVVFHFGFRWRWIIGFNHQIFTDSAAATVQFEHNGVACVMWQTLRDQAVLVELVASNMLDDKKDAIITRMENTAKKFTGSMETQFDEFTKELLEDTVSNDLKNLTPYQWHLLVSKKRPKFKYDNMDYYFLHVMIDESISVLLFGLPMRKRLDCLNSLFRCFMVQEQLEQWKKDINATIGEYLEQNSMDNAFVQLSKKFTDTFNYYFLCLQIQGKHSESSTSTISESLVLKDYNQPFIHKYTYQEWHLWVACAYKEKYASPLRVTLQCLGCIMCCPCICCLSAVSQQARDACVKNCFKKYQ